LEKYGRNIAELNTNELAAVCQRADKSFDLESKVIGSAEAENVLISQEQIEKALHEVESRYENREDFISDLEDNGISESALARALYRELVFDLVMNKVASNAAQVSELDLQLYYQMHKDKFTKPETRQARHILITVNDSFTENQRDMALDRMQKLQERVKKNPSKFQHLAMQNSECPTALQGGDLGIITKNTLFPALDVALFELKEGQVSPVIESELGFHVLFCEKIYSPMKISYSEAKPRIKLVLDERQRRNCQKAWIKNLGVA